MTRAEARKIVYEQFPMPKKCCARQREKIEQARYEAVEKMIKRESKKEYGK